VAGRAKGEMMCTYMCVGEPFVSISIPRCSTDLVHSTTPASLSRLHPPHLIINRSILSQAPLHVRLLPFVRAAQLIKTLNPVQCACILVVMVVVVVMMVDGGGGDGVCALKKRPTLVMMIVGMTTIISRSAKNGHFSASI
jgi:hypothetical protein